MRNETAYFEGRETRKLFYQYWLPESDDIKAYIVMIHGFGIHSDMLKIPAEYFTEKGYAIYSFDLRGHWRSAGNIPGHIDSLDLLVQDIVLFMYLIKETAGNKKIFLAGNSFGGMICLKYALKRALAGIIVLSPLMDLSLNKNFGKKFIKRMSRLAPKITLSFNIDYKELTSDLKTLKIFHTDKNLTKVISSKTVSEMRENLKQIMNNPQELFCPILFMQAGNDKYVDIAKTRKFFEKIKSEDKTYQEYDGFLHELLFERKKAQVYQDMYIWLEKHK